MSQRDLEVSKRETGAAAEVREQPSSRINVEIVRASWEAWRRRDMEALFGFYDPAIEWDMTRSDVPDMGVFYGHDGVRAFFREWRAPFEDYHAEAEEFIDAGESVIVRVRQGGRGSASAVGVEMPAHWQLYRLRAGRAVRVEIYREESEALEAARLRSKGISQARP
jgi:ketosteroid isomerase-like protein